MRVVWAASLKPVRVWVCHTAFIEKHQGYRPRPLPQLPSARRVDVMPRRERRLKAAKHELKSKALQHLSRVTEDRVF